VEHRRAELQTEIRDAAGDDSARFLRELRQLRGGAGLGHAELAARAHYPCDAIQAAEAGPSLPDLPVLSAYVRGCGGTPAEWEERWRSLTHSPALPLLPVRPAGGSDAATAGARVGSTSLAADGHDPHIIMAALGRVADGMAASAQADSPVAEARRSKPTAAAAPAALPMAATVAGAMAATAAGPEAAVASVAPGVVARRDASVTLAAPGAGQATDRAFGSGPASSSSGAASSGSGAASSGSGAASSGSSAASRATVRPAVPTQPASGQVVADRRHLLPPRTMVTALSVALVVGVVATVVVVVVAVLALFA
jgi:hypothetical protein